MSDGRAILLYDGVCGLCSRMVRFVLARDRGDVFRFAALQSDYAAAALARHGRDAARLDTVYVLVDAGTGGERVLARSRAILYVLRRLGGPWRLLTVFGVLPTPLLDAAYGLVARTRYRLFGRLDACALPSEATRAKFLDAP